MHSMTLFTLLVIGHVITGLIVLISFWVPIASRKGGANHRRWGHIFTKALYAAAWFAIAMALLNLTTANDRHPTLTDRRLFDGLFGWMMLYLGILTLGLGRYGLEAARHHGRGGAGRTPFNIAIQAIVMIAAINCGWHGFLLGQPLMIGLAALGLGAAITFLIALLRPSTKPNDHVREHLKAMVGAGISAYTAFLSVGLLQIVPDHVFNPAIWAIPSAVGVALIIVHLRRIDVARRGGLHSQI
jgi:hypothetical protein